MYLGTETSESKPNRRRQKLRSDMCLNGPFVAFFFIFIFSTIHSNCTKIPIDSIRTWDGRNNCSNKNTDDQIQTIQSISGQLYQNQSDQMIN